MKRMHTEEEIQELAAHPIGDVSIDGDLAVDGDFEANSVSADSIIENMSGYSVSLGTKTNLTNTGIYASAVKTGNKLTLVAAVKLKRTGEISGGNADVITFNIPQSVGEKLMPFTLDGIEALDFRQVDAAKNYASSVKLPTICGKNSNTQIKLRVYNLGNLTQDSEYYLRFEWTFLLSDSLLD